MRRALATRLWLFRDCCRMTLPPLTSRLGASSSHDAKASSVGNDEVKSGPSSERTTCVVMTSMPSILVISTPIVRCSSAAKSKTGWFFGAPQVLARRTPEYRAWVEGYARNHKIPILKAEKGVSKEDLVRPHLQRMERRCQHGVYCIFTGMEMGSTFNSRMPKFPTEDPDYRIIRRVPSRFLHYYFYIRDPVIGPLAMCVGTY